MNTTANDSVMTQLLHMGLDKGSVDAAQAKVAIDQFDNWSHPAGLGFAPYTGGTRRSIAQG